MNAGTLTIDIATNVARIKADMDETKRVIGAAMKDVEQVVGFAKTAFIGLIGVGSVAAFKGLIDGAIATKSRLYDMSLQTGISVEALSALGRVAKYSNTELGEVAAASNKMSKALFTQNEESKGAAQAIKALGINFNDFTGLGADEQMLKVAKALDKFQDGSGKSAAAMLLFGKQGATLLPFLKELAEKNELVGKQTTESAKQAKEYEDNLITLKNATEQWRRELAEFLLPALVGVTNELIDGRKAYGSYGAAFLDFLKGSQNPSKGLNDTREQLSKLNTELSELDAKGNKSSSYNLFSSLGTERKRKELQDDIAVMEQRKAFQIAQQTREALAGSGGVLDKFDRPKAKLNLVAGEDKVKTTKDLADGYDTLMSKIREKIALDQAELEMGRELTEAEKFQISVYEDVEKNFDKLSIAKLLAIDEATQLYLKKAKEREAFEAEIKYLKEAGAENVKYLTTQQEISDQLKGQQRDAELQLATYGKTTDQLRALESARLRDAAAALDRKAALADEIDTGLSGEYRKQASALNATADARDRLAARQTGDRNDPLAGADRALKEYLADVERAGDATYGAVANSIKSLEDLTVTALSGGDAKNAAKAWVNGILSEVLRLVVVKPLLKSIFGDSSAGADWGGAFKAGLNALLGSGGNTGLNSAGDGYYSNESRNYGGPRASGGFVSAGTDYLVGERGPEVLRMNGQSGTVIPNAESGKALQITFAPVTHIDSRTDRAEVATLVAESQRENNRQLIDQLRVHGVL